MKKRGSMAFLMELIVVILFFSLSTAVTLRLFVAAHEKERESTRLSDAVERAQDTAEQFRVKGTALFASSDGWTYEIRDDLSALYTRVFEEGLTVTVLVTDDAGITGILENGEICVYSGTDTEPCCRLPLSRFVPFAEEVPQ